MKYNKSKILSVVMYILFAVVLLGLSVSTVYALSDYIGETAEYSITWEGGEMPDGYSFDYDCPSEAKAGEIVTISISNTVGTGSSDVINIYVDWERVYGGVQFTDIVFTDQVVGTFTMPEADVTITYIVYDSNTGGYV